MLQEQDKQEIKNLFNGWMEVLDQRKELNDTAKEMKNKAAAILNTKPAMVGKIFSALKKKTEDGEDELEEIYHHINEISS